MDGEITAFESPIDVMYLIHKALRSEANRAEKLVATLDVGSTLQGFKLAFNHWATMLVFHAEQEDIYITEPLTRCLPQGMGTLNAIGDTLGLSERVKAAMLAHEDELHRELLEAVENVFAVLNEDIGKTSLIIRTKQHLIGQVVALRIVQEDHLDTEESLVMPLVRERLSERQQLEAARGLLIDELADDPRWVIDWVAGALTPTEQKLLTGVEKLFQGLPISAN